MFYLICVIFSSESSIKLNVIDCNTCFISFSSKEINVPSSINNMTKTAIRDGKILRIRFL